MFRCRRGINIKEISVNAQNAWFNCSKWQMETSQEMISRVVKLWSQTNTHILTLKWHYCKMFKAQTINKKTISALAKMKAMCTSVHPCLTSHACFSFCSLSYLCAASPHTLGFHFSHACQSRPIPGRCNRTSENTEAWQSISAKWSPELLWPCTLVIVRAVSIFLCTLLVLCFSTVIVRRMTDRCSM